MGSVILGILSKKQSCTVLLCMVLIPLVAVLMYPLCSVYLLLSNDLYLVCSGI